MAAYFIKADPDTGTTAHWCEDLQCHDGRIVSGRGLTEAQAEDDALTKKWKWESIIEKSPIEQLELICKDDDICQRDVTRAIKLITRILSEWPGSGPPA